MRQALGVALGLGGLAIALVPTAVTIWTAHHASVGVSQTGTGHLTTLILAGLGCLVASYALLRN
jgi:hypothetical protein